MKREAHLKISWCAAAPAEGGMDEEQKLNGSRRKSAEGKGSQKNSSEVYTRTKRVRKE